MEQIKIQQGYSKKRDTTAYYAAIYLLSSSSDLYQRTARCFVRRGIDFSYADLSDISTDNYTLFQLAKHFYSTKENFSLFDIADPDIVSDRVFSVFLTGSLITRYGPDALKLSL